MEKPPVIKENKGMRNKNIRFYILSVAIIIAGIFQGRILNNIFKDEERAWNRERSLYEGIREKNMHRLSTLLQELEDLDKKKLDIERRLQALISDKTALEREKEGLLKNLEKTKGEVTSSIARREQEVRTLLSAQYDKEIALLKQKLGEFEKMSEPEDNKEAEELMVKNKELLDSLIKANKSNEYLTQKIEDLNKIRLELEGELRRRNE